MPEGPARLFTPWHIFFLALLVVSALAQELVYFASGPSVGWYVCVVGILVGTIGSATWTIRSIRRRERESGHELWPRRER